MTARAIFRSSTPAMCLTSPPIVIALGGCCWRSLAASRPPTFQANCGWEYLAEVVIEAPLETVARCVPRALGRLEPVDSRTSRLTGSTGNPYWYAEQLAVLPASFRVLGGVELRATTRALGERLLAAGAGPGRG